MGSLRWMILILRSVVEVRTYMNEEYRFDARGLEHRGLLARAQ